MKVQIVGPVVSEYSLARVNRLLAKHLSNIKDYQVSLYAPDYLAGAEVKSSDISRYPVLKLLTAEQGNPDVQIYNGFPKGVSQPLGLKDLQAPTVIPFIAWEETVFPVAWVDEINQNARLVFAISTHVARVLENNGVNVPVLVVPLGVEEVMPDKSGLPQKSVECRFLHISSGHARKGLDVLLDAYAEEFDADDDVELVLKIFPNPNVSLQEVAKRFEQEGAPKLTIISEPDLTDAQIAGLYQEADCVVLPARAEGFGLPVAEAMLTQTLVITTGYSGQMDFVNEHNSLLLDFALVPAVESHHGLPGSMWAEPDKQQLKEYMRKVYKDPQSAELNAVREKAKQTAQTLTWKTTAASIAGLLDTIPALDTLAKKRLAVVSPIHTKGGVAEYTRELYAPVRGLFKEFMVLADIAVPLEEDLNVKRVWNFGTDDADELLGSLGSYKPDIVHIHYHTDFFTPAALYSVLRDLAGGPDVYVTMHILPTDIDQAALSICKEVIVHAKRDKKRLEQAGVENTVIHLHGIPDALPRSSGAVKSALGISHQTVLASHGLVHDKKGFTELIKAMPLLLGQFPDMLLLLVTAVSSDNSTSQGVFSMMQDLVTEHALEHHVRIIPEFLDFNEVVTLLQAADLAVLPYYDLGEGTSGAARTIVASGTPLVTTDIDMFSDLAAAYKISDNMPATIAQGVAMILKDQQLMHEYTARVRELQYELSWRVVAYEYAISFA